MAAADPVVSEDIFKHGRDCARERVLRGKRAVAVAGRPAGRPPYGYRRAIDPTTGKTDTWAIDEATGPIVKEVIGPTLAGESLWAIVDWLNEHTDPDSRFLGVQIEVVQIGESIPAPNFKLVAQPNDWEKQVKAATSASALTDKSQL